MLALAQFGGLQAALKRRNSKVGKPQPPQQLPNSSNLALPGGIRRFSSTETLSSHQPYNLPAVATVTRRSSLSRRIRKVSSSSSHGPPDLNTVCMQLDLHFAKIKRKLAEFREEDIEIADRVDELVNSVADLCEDFQIVPVTPPPPPPPLSIHSMINLRHSYPPYGTGADGMGVDGDRGGQFNTSRRNSESESEEEDENFQQFCCTHSHWTVKYDVVDDTEATCPVAGAGSYKTMPNIKWSSSDGLEQQSSSDSTTDGNSWVSSSGGLKQPSSSDNTMDKNSWLSSSGGLKQSPSTGSTVDRNSWLSSSDGLKQSPSSNNTMDRNSWSFASDNSMCLFPQPATCSTNPQDYNWDQFWTHFYHGGHRPLSYQEIAYEESDHDDPAYLNVEGVAGWGDLSCP